jgi:hypothetical protein
MSPAVVDKYAIPPSEHCKHESQELRRWTFSNGVDHFKNECRVCGQSGESIARACLAAEEMAAAPPHDAGLRGRFGQKAADHRRADLEAERVADRAAWHEEHDPYLKTPEWKHRRDLVLKRAHHLCEGCGEQMAVIGHHRTYDHYGDEFLFEILALCPDCHDRFHRRGRYE